MSQENEESMFVAVRLRPLNEKEKKREDKECWKVLPEFNSIALSSSTSGRDTFTYDHIYGTDSRTKDIYDQIVDPIVHSVVEGVHGTVFAYGQTSCGKTYTMQGHGSTPGILQMAVLGIFEKIESCPDREFLFRVSYIEIYNEVVRDLLDTSCSVLKIRESRSRGVFVEAAERIVTDFSDITAALRFGDKQRHVEETKMNERSSRSHTIFKITLESKERVSDDGDEEDGAVLVAHLNLVDLAGSENVRHTGVAGERLREAGKINTSLLTLSRIIKSLASGNQAHLGFRDSKLTRLLQESLTGKTRTALIACATPSAHYVEETKSTLLFAQRAKTVKTCAEVNEILDDAAMLKRLRRDLKKAQTELESLKEGKQNTNAIEEMKVREKRSMEERERLEAQLSKLEKEKEAAMRTVTNLKQSLLCSTKISGSSTGDSDQMRKTNLSTHTKAKTKRSRKQFRETWCPGTSITNNTFRAVQEFRRELDDTIVSKYQEEDDVMQVDNLDLMQLESASELEIAQFCEQEHLKFETRTKEIEELSKQNQEFCRQIQQNQESLKERDAKIVSLSQQIRDFENSASQMRSDLSTKRIDTVNLSKQCTQLRQLSETKHSELVRFQEDVRSHAEMTKEFQIKYEQIREKNENLLKTKSKECQELLSKIETLRSQCELERSSVRDLQIEHASHVQQLKSEFQSNVENIRQEHTTQVENMRKDHASHLEESKSTFQNKLEADVEIARAMSVELESLQQENESLKTQIASISGDSSKLSAENLEMSQRIEMMSVQLEDHEKCATLKDSLSEYREKLEQSENQNDALDATIMARDEKILEFEKKLEMSENQVEALEATVMARDEKIREMEENRIQEIEEMEKKITGLEGQAANTEKLTTLQGRTIELERSVETRDEQIHEMSIEIERVTEELASMEEKKCEFQEMSTEMERLTGELANMEEEKTQSELRVCELKSTIEKLNMSLKDSQKRISKLESVKLTESQVARMIEMKKEWKALKKEKKQGLWQKQKSVDVAQHKAEIESLEDRISGLTAQKRKLKETLAKRDSALKQAREMMKEVHSELADAKTVRVELKELKQRLSESNAELEESKRDIKSFLEIQAQAKKSANEARQHKALVQRLREDKISIQADIETLRMEQNEMKANLKTKDAEIQRIRKHVQVLEKENLDLMLKSENLDVGAPKISSASSTAKTSLSKQEDYSFNDDNTFDDEGLLLGDNSLMEDVRAAVASEAEKENTGRVRSTKMKKRRQKRGLTPAKSNVMIENGNISVKKRKLSNDNDDHDKEEMKMNILAPTEPKIRERNDQVVRPAILSQPSADDGDNPECAQQ